MMMYRIDLARRVQRQLEELPDHIRQRVKRAIAKLAFNPRPEYAEELRGNLAGRHKICLDQYRVVYRIDDEVAVVKVVKAGKKHGSFYDALA